VRDSDKFTHKTIRATPSQTRGKERVRVILAAALALFKERGLDHVTTNDIVERAGVPIGSLYRYYPNKDSIIAALADLYVADLSDIFDEVGSHPMLKHLSWEEVLILMIDGWVSYLRLNGSFPLLFAIKADPRLFAQNRATWQRLVKSFSKVIRKRCPAMSEKDVTICFQFCLAATEMSINSDHYPALGPQPHYDAISVIAAYMLSICAPHKHAGDILS
jgi:AcrR family transcriptional regulator